MQDKASLTLTPVGAVFDASSANTLPSGREVEGGSTFMVSSLGSVTFDELGVTDVTSSSLFKSVFCWIESPCSGCWTANNWLSGTVTTATWLLSTPPWTRRIITVVHCTLSRNNEWLTFFCPHNSQVCLNCPSFQAWTFQVFDRTPCAFKQEEHMYWKCCINFLIFQAAYHQQKATSHFW